MPANLLPLQSGMGNTCERGAVRAGGRSVRDLTSYTEVIQDGMIGLLKFGQVDVCLGNSVSP